MYKCSIPESIWRFALVLASFLTTFTPTSYADDNSIILQSTTSTQNSGLYEYLLPLFEATSSIRVRVVAVGTGQAISNARRCDGDMLIVHSTDDEMEFVANGYGIARHDLMYNDFVILGPQQDPAKIRSMTLGYAAFAKIAEAKLAFASRGDNSGTHKAEQRLWKNTNTMPKSGVQKWYRETGSSMGSTLNFAVQTGAYVLSDRATWLAFGNKADHEILVEGDPALFNQYGVITVNPTVCPNSNIIASKAFATWLLSATGQKAIAAYQRGGHQLFFPNAK